MKTYKFYLKASKFFLNPSNSKNLNVEEREYDNIASTLLSWMSLESYVNAVCDSLSRGTRLKDHERSFLLEEELKVDGEGNFRKVKIRPPTLKKMLFIIQNFSKIEVKEFKQKELWNRLRAFEDLRNKIVHHKETIDFNIDQQKALEFTDLVNDTINYVGHLLTRVPRKRS
jgi:hypothetical protein